MVVMERVVSYLLPLNEPYPSRNAGTAYWCARYHTMALYKTKMGFALHCTRPISVVYGATECIRSYVHQQHWEVNALEISAIGTDVARISTTGTDLVSTFFQCHLHDTDFQCTHFGALIFSTTLFSDTDFQYLDLVGTDFQYYIFLQH